MTQQSPSPVGFAPLDQDPYHFFFARSLAKIGFKLGDWTQDRMAKELEIPILPLGRGEGFVLRLQQDWDQSWAFGSLEKPNKEALAEFKFDPTLRHSESCYMVWVRAIVRAVRESGRPFTFAVRTDSHGFLRAECPDHPLLSHFLEEEIGGSLEACEEILASDFCDWGWGGNACCADVNEGEILLQHEYVEGESRLTFSEFRRAIRKWQEALELRLSKRSAR